MTSASLVELFQSTARKLLPEGWRVDPASRSSRPDDGIQATGIADVLERADRG
jgi:hypothetical protein